MDLLAKSVNKKGDKISIKDHSLKVYEMIDLLYKENSRAKESWLRFFNITKQNEESFFQHLRVAALLHDIGKANEDFQKAINNPGSINQSIRHEHISALTISFPKIKEWLIKGNINPNIIIAAVLSHHIKASLIGDKNGNYKFGVLKNSKKVKLYLDHNDIFLLFQKVSNILNIDYIPSIPNEDYENTDNNSWFKILKEISSSQKFRRELKNNELLNLTLAVKAGLIVCDSLASGLVRENKNIIDWLNENIHTPNITEEEIYNAILKPRANEIEQKTGKIFELHNFQKLAGEENDRTLLITPCGSGKTLAAWQWAKRRAKDKKFGRVIFLYPTKGTATEGFKDYVGWAPEGQATLLHSSSKFELERILENPPDSLDKKELSKLEAEERMFALGLWKFRFFSSTVDQFLSFLQNIYKGICLLPALADSVIILDEIHSYDKTMLDMLITLLNKFNIPVLCMTATLLPNKLNKLLNTGLSKFPKQEQLLEMKDLIDTSNYPRYNITFNENADSSINIGINEYKKGNKVLIVVNRVKRCFEVANQIELATGKLPLIYHSRFKLKDRYVQHTQVVNAFKSNEPSICVTTQVCEMSLDLDADVLITEVAPVSSLVQRFGRSNRKLTNEKISNNFSSEIIIYSPKKVSPYSKDEIKIATEFSKYIIGKKSQNDLEIILESGKFDLPENNYDNAGRFIIGGYFAIPGSFRDEDTFGCVPSIIENDLQTVINKIKNKEPIDGYIVPAPRDKLKNNKELPIYLGYIPYDCFEYDERIGLIING